MSELGYARMYKNKSSRSAADFLYRPCYLVNQSIKNLQTDNGSESAWEFERATAKLGIQRYFSRVKTPKDNPEIERFNENLDYEGLIEYNFNRPRQSRGYLTPIDYIEKELFEIRSPVLPMWSARTNVCVSLLYMIEYSRGIHMRNAFIPSLSYEIT